MPPHAPDDSEPLNVLVQECADQWAEQGSKILDDLCARHPERAADLRRRIGLLERTGMLEPVARAPVEQLGDFRLVAQLGHGGMGVVYRAEQLSLRREVALKVIRPDQSFFADSRQRFLREVNAIARLQHPGIVPVHAAGEDGGVLYYAMELVPGCTLAQVLTALRGREPATLHSRDLVAAIVQSAPPAADAPELLPGLGGSWVECCLRLVQQIAEALEHAHGRGVLHRDVKPSNVMIARSGRVMLLDFGLASTDSDARITRSGSVVGSLAYMAPEQVRGDAAAITRNTDVYGAGLLLYELLTLRQPFLLGNNDLTRQLVLAGNPAALRSLNPAVSTDAELVCRKAMDPDPTRRYPSALALAHDLANVLELRPIEARAPSPWLRLRRAAQRHPVRTASLAFASVLLLLVFPFLYLQQRAARLDLQAEQGRTAAALREANAALIRAEAQEKRARWGLGKAREAVDRFLADIGEFRAVDIPLLEQLRRDTLQQAVMLYEQLLQDPDAERDGTLAFEHARTSYSLALVLRDLGRATEAVPVLHRVIAALEAQDSSVAVPASYRLLASARSSLGATLLPLDREAEAEAHLVRAGEELVRLAGEGDSPGEATSSVELLAVRTALLRNTVTLASLRRAQRRTDEAATLFKQTVLLGEAADRSIEVLRTLADAHRGLGLVLASQSASALAKQRYVQVVELRRDLLARAPTSARFRKELAGALQDLGSHVQSWSETRFPEALESLDEAAVLTAALVRDYPRQSGFRIDHSRVRLVTANLRQRMARSDDAERDMREAIEGLQAARAELPRERSWRVPLSFALYSLARLYQGEGRQADADAQIAAAQALLDELRREQPEDLELLQQHAELSILRSAATSLDAAQRLAVARAACALSRPFLLEHMQDAKLYGTAFHAFENLASLVCASGDVRAALAVADEYRAAKPYKWLCQLTLARTYLRCCALSSASAPADDADASALRQRCFDAARQAVQAAAEHSLRAVLRIEDDPVFAPLVEDDAIVELLARARAAKG